MSSRAQHISRISFPSLFSNHIPPTGHDKILVSSSQLRAMSAEAQAAKKALRKDIKARLSSLDPSEIATQSQQAQNVILNLDAYKRARSLSIYLSMPAAEAQTDVLVMDALSEGKKVFVPFLYTPAGSSTTSGKKRKVMDLLRLRSVEEYEGLERDAWGIPSLGLEGVDERENAMGGKGLTLANDFDPESGRKDGNLDLVVVPAVAFDAQMNRLGHGAGFYDAFFTRFCQNGKRPKPYLVGLCLAEQILGQEHELPTADWDWRVDAVAAGHGKLLT
ncbi:hypothetical protein WHR41_05383 [Cladosporium halotolerans]|uniref:5-formyltetrahydrofolate cyclo-ligase n=1 Tax=Cladosporium halotolerans TaxID=1052096 RepID=A0AB34KMZ2_9PEZI